MDKAELGMTNRCLLDIHFIESVVMSEVTGHLAVLCCVIQATIWTKNGKFTDAYMRHSASTS